MTLKFKDLYFSKEMRFSVGVEESHGDYYVSIPVSNRMVDYEEYYKIDESIFRKYEKNLSELSFIADECRIGLRDKDLIIKPGSDRGVPS